MRDLRSGVLDCIVQVQMLGEGFDHPKLSVAAIFRPFRSLAPYIQFVGRILRVVVQNSRLLASSHCRWGITLNGSAAGATAGPKFLSPERRRPELLTANGRGVSTDRTSGLPVSTLAGQIGRPVVHESPKVGSLRS